MTMSRPARMLLTTIVLSYVALGTILGFVQGGVAPVLRSQGVELAAMRWVYALYLPFGLAFSWASRIDRWHWPWLGPRTGWIVPMQALTVLSLLVIAAIAPGPGVWTLLLLLGLVATVSAATMDVALDALTVELIPEPLRAAAAGAKMGGVALGSIIGGGLLVAGYPALQWRGTLQLMALIVALSCLPMLTLVRQDRQRQIRQTGARPRLRDCLRTPLMRSRFLRLTLLTCSLIALFSFGRLMLVDMGVPLERIGYVLGIIAPIATACTCVLTPFALRHVPVQKALVALGALCLTGALLVWLALLQRSPDLLMAGTIVTTAAAAGLYVALGGLILIWAQGSQAATDYALLYGVGRLLGTVALMALPGLAATLGWPVFQSALILLFAIALWCFRRTLAPL